MGTRSLTHIIDDEGKAVLLTIYRQFDGYPEGMGKDLAEILNRGNVVNGYTDAPTDAFNTMGCLAAQVVAGLKVPNEEGGKPIGNVYIYPTDSKDCGEEYVYRVLPPESIPGTPILEAYEAGPDGGPGEMIFKGSPAEFLASKHAKAS